MLRFILGKSGSGKTSAAVDIITKLRKSGNKKLMMLVPDQTSFLTEKTFLQRLGPLESRDVLVFGFNRLCGYVFKNTGNIPQNVIDDGVRNILMSKALDEVKDKLGVFSGKKKRRSVLDLMIHSLKECKKDGITTDMLRDVSENVESEILRNKLVETSLVLDAYDALLSRTYVDPLENLNRLADILTNNDMFSGYTIAVDSFSGFTYQQLRVIELLMRRGSDFYVTLNLDPEYRKFDIFETTERTRKLIKRIAVSNSIEIGESIVLPDFLRSKNDDISFLEKYALKINNKVYDKKSDNITTHIASNIHSEARYIAGKIKSLVYNNGYRYGDIAVVCRGIEKYNGVLDAVFDKYGIPYFCDMPRDVFISPVIRFVSYALEAAASGFDRESVLSMLKTGLTTLSESQISDFENYTFIWNIDRSDLLSVFANNPSGFEKFSDNDEKKLAEIEETRKLIMNPLEKFRDSVKNSNVKEITGSLYNLLCDYKIESAVDQYYDRLESQGLVFEAKEIVRVYNSLIDVFDKLIAAAGDETPGLKKYKEYLEFLIADIKLSDIPRYQDQVNIATADRARLSDEKVVFIIGAVDGEFPSVPQTAGIFSENERKTLVENNIPLSDSLEQLASHEKYLVYCALTSASDKVFVTCYNSDYAGESFDPSIIFGEALRLFPKRSHSTELDFGEVDELYCKSQAFEYFARNFNSDDKKTNALRSYFESDEYYGPFVEKIEKAVKKQPFAIADKTVSEKLFTKNMSVSASQIETYNKCAFRYFCQYGLRARERRKAAIDDMQFGTIVHYYLEHFLKVHNKKVLNELSDKDISCSIDAIMLSYADENLGGLSDKSESFLALFERLKINLFELTKQIIRQLSYSDFIPTDFELHIGGEIPPYKLELDSDSSVSVNGYIDRVDVFKKNDDECYVRVVDYKTGNKSFKLYEILYGINLQMLIYLRAVEQNGKDYYKSGIIPAGILYMPSSASDIDGDKYKEEKDIRDQKDLSLRMNGLVLGNEEVLEHMDRAGKFIKYSKKIIDGKYSDSVASGEQFADIFAHIDRIIRQMGTSLLSGKVKAEPAKGAVDGCMYCPYDSVCLRTYEDDYRFLKTADAKEVYVSLEKEGELS